MFGTFRKSKSKTAISKAKNGCGLSDEKMLGVIRETFAAHNEAASALFLVAYENFFVYSSIFMRAEEREPRYGASLDGLAVFLEESRLKLSGASIQEEVGSRRFFYLYLATLLKIIEGRADKRPELWEDIALLWVQLLPGARALRKTLDCTQLWTVDEIIYFKDIDTEEDGEKYCLQIMIPPEIRYNSIIIEWQERDLSPEVKAELRAIEALMRGE